MTRLIDADNFGVISLQGKSEEFIEGVLFILDKIYEAPTIEERPHGEWIDEGAMAEGHPHRAFNCSVCDGHICRVSNDLPNFCEFCGADMREGDPYDRA